MFQYKRRDTIPVRVGEVEIGGNNPIRVQSMANTDTNDIASSVAQAMRIEAAGGEIVRFTAQGVKEALNLGLIREELRARSSSVPLVADIHFNPQAAFTAAEKVEKVRINPGNFVDRVHTQKHFDYTDEEYQLEIEKIKEKLYPLLDICKRNSTAIRIGVNHGSLSDRILSRYGDTSYGMVESCMEFLRLCVAYDFFSIVISVKASNTMIMVETVRLLDATMEKENMKFPLHLGVTEAGDGEDGRVKSALGIGALLQDGIGDTIRVSLSEAPEHEIPVAKKLVEYVTATAPLRRDGLTPLSTFSASFDPYSYHKRDSLKFNGIGGLPVVVASLQDEKSDYYFSSKDDVLKRNTSDVATGDLNVKFFHIGEYERFKSEYAFYSSDTVLVLDPFICKDSQDGINGQREFFHRLMNDGIKIPVIIRRRYDDVELEDLQIKAAADFGQFFIDGLGDGIWVDAPNFQQSEVTSLMFTILQGARVRFSKTEYISCPGCGRTLYDLEATIARIKKRTSHLKGLKIGVMGCIVNGPGEMADADYGYVGSARGMVNLYKGQTCIEKLIPEAEAVERLVQLIKDNGDWRDA